MIDLQNLKWRKFAANLHRRSGVVLILAAVIFTSLLVMTGVVIDLGQAYVYNSELQKTADAAAFAASTLLPIQVSSASGLEKQSQAELLAREYLAKNDSGDAEFDGIDFGDSFTDDADGTMYTSIRVRLRRPVDFIFGPIIGLDGTTLSRHAKVRIEAVVGNAGIAPLGIEKDVQDATPDGQSVDITFAPGSEDLETGNFGLLDLDAIGGGADQFYKYCTDGYFGDMILGDAEEALNIKTGVNMGKVVSSFDARYDACPHSPACTPDHYVPGCPRILIIVVYQMVDVYPAHFYVPIGFSPYCLVKLTGNVVTVEKVNEKIKVGKTAQLNDFNYDFGLYRTRLVE